MAGKKRKDRCQTKRLCVVRHDSEKLLLVDLAILVKVKFIYHRLSGNLIISQSTRAKINRITYSSSSSSRSPISLATRRRLRMDIFPVLSSSNSWNARRISSIGSRANILSVTVNNQHHFFSPREKNTRDSTDLDKVVVLEQTVPGLVVVPQRLEHLRLLEIEPERPHGHF